MLHTCTVNPRMHGSIVMDTFCTVTIQGLSHVQEVLKTDNTLSDL